MYVDPRYRGLGVAERLMRATIQHAIALHYTRLRLDTLERLQAANRLYKRMGYRTIPRYNDCPIEGVIWFELELSIQAGSAADNSTLL